MHLWRIVLAGSLLLGLAPMHAQPLAHTGLDEGYFDMYNLDFAGAHRVFEAWTAGHPEDPLGPASDAAAFLFAEFDRLGVLDIELFADEDRFTSRQRPASDPAIRRDFDQRVDQAESIAAQALARNANDARALYARTMVAGLHADYAAMIDKKDYAALKYTEQASTFARKTLAADPTLVDAQLAVGVENYMLSLKPAPIRFFLAIRGDQTSKQEGIQRFRDTAEKGHFLAPFARLMLAVAELKDQHPDQARELLASLARDFPQNTLYARQLARIR